ncbi:hypothetical protein F52700_9340 [Fusarium sp. NRRL 52700]|nr:hypothetical protein F52700_9340 [Fusarium sp. NRRL 52700]
MSVPVGLQLGVELTNFVGPLTKTALRLGTLAVREAIERSGSDELTELKLAHILGRHRLDPAIDTHFRSIVARSDHAPLSQFVKELVLESGSGPTVSQALVSNNVALFSMVVQVSFLAFSHDHQSLSQALTQAIDDMLTDSKTATSHGLNYVSLLGTVAACQQQTTAFSWEPHYATIEHKILGEMKAKSRTTSRPLKRRRISEQSGNRKTRIHQQSVADRALPFVMLRGLLTSLDSIQKFPEDCLLQLSSDRGISSIVLWCYHIMGLSVLVRISDATIHFGNGPYNITIEHCNPTDTSVVLLQKAAENIPVFTLMATDVDPYIQSDQRRSAKGFLRQVLKLQGVDEAELGEYASGLVSECIRHFDSHQEQSSSETFTSSHSLETNSAAFPEEAIELASMNTIIRPGIIATASFLFEIDEAQLGDGIGGPGRTKAKRTRPLWSAAMALIHAFSRVQELTTCSQLPLSLDAFEMLNNEDYLKTDKGGFHGPILDTICSFELISKLVGTHIGYHDHDAFTVVQLYEWANTGQKCKKWRLGFREKQEMSMEFKVYRKCSCLRLQDAVETRRVLDSLLIWPVVAKQEAGRNPEKYIAKHPEDSWNASKTPERIFLNGETWFFYVTGDSAARWLGLDALVLLRISSYTYSYLSTTLKIDMESKSLPQPLPRLVPADQILLTMKSIINLYQAVRESIIQHVNPQTATFGNVIQPLTNIDNGTQGDIGIIAMLQYAFSDQESRQASEEACTLINKAQAAFTARSDFWCLIKSVKERSGEATLHFEAQKYLHKIFVEFEQFGHSTLQPEQIKHQNSDIFKQIVLERDLNARLLGYESHAAYRLKKRLMKTPDKVEEFLRDLETQLLARGKRDMKSLVDLKKQYEAENFIDEGFDGDTMFPWDYWYYAHMAQQRRHINQERMAEYFPLQHVIKVMLEMFSQFLKIEFCPLSPDQIKDSVWHQDVQAWAVWDNGGTSKGQFVGYLYMDLLSRDNKYKGNQNVNLQCIVSLFHELGHGIHDLLARTNYVAFHGHRSPPDFAEALSVMLERWCWMEPELKRLGLHYTRTDPQLKEKWLQEHPKEELPPAQIPDDMIKRLIQGRQVTRSLWFLRQMWVFAPCHTELLEMDFTKVYYDLMEKLWLVRAPEPEDQGYPHADLDHLVSGYDAGYYSYLRQVAFTRS